ncbi:hypothetical protein [Alteromonas ponticola]|uniref:DUF1579 domain-containing protein n=1 Tax=Alteromonas ponticola TaxID=2720613 RepID=A0ABX1R127_9ALTE|nr:hypothetical protein [Alteromonas ponticola]NMH60154.1 hypothetical protein [Alteromonas ponticola]
MNHPSVPTLLTIICFLLTAFCAGACTDKAYADFDFWLGEWKVTTPDGTTAGYNSIKKAFNNCVVTEHYQTKDGLYGTSLNIYDQTTGKWHQSWVDKTGLRLQLTGGVHDGAMILTGEATTKKGERVEHKISWTPQQNDSVIQHWEMRKVDTENWQTLFKGIYTLH